MAVCVAAAGVALHLAVASFTLSWVHSVEKIPWQESWQADADGLRPIEARIKGSGAGMDPPEDAVLRDGWYVFHPQVPPLREVVLAASGETVSGWTLCTADACHELGATASAPVRISLCN
jgi:hypothetical protein